jgi:hypothetical protein
MNRSLAAAWVLAALVPAAAPASTVRPAADGAQVLHAVPDVAHTDFTSYFDFDRTSGRAWVEVALIDTSVRDDSPLSSIAGRVSVKAPGLAWDPAGSRIAYRFGDREVTCATVAPRRVPIGPRDRVRATGACVIEGEVVKLARDDGFRVREVPHLQLTLRASDAR